MRINPASASLANTKPAIINRTADRSAERAASRTANTAGAPETGSAPASKAKAHGVIRKLGTGHYRDSVELKLTARFAPERLAPPASEPLDPAIDPGTDPAIDPQIIPDGETPGDPNQAENDPTTVIASGDGPLTPETLLTRSTTSAFAQFNLIDFAQSTSVDLIA